MAHQRVAVGVQADWTPSRPARRPSRTRSGAEQPVGLDDTRAGAGDVVLVRAEQARVLGGLAADQRAAGEHAALGDALDDRGDPLGHDLAAGDVVGHEQRLGAADHEVVDDHADQVEADRVVPVGGRGDGDLGADAVGRGREQRTPVGRERAGVEQPGEPADAADHLGPGRLGHPGLHQLDRAVAGLDVDAGRGVARAGLVTAVLERVGAPAPPTRWRDPARLRRRRGVRLTSSRCLPSSSGSGSSTG